MKTMATLIVAAVVSQGVAVAQEDAAPPPADAAAAEGDDVPFHVKEAKLPEGFPPPGKVNVVAVKQYPTYRMAFVRAADVQEQDGPRRRQDSMFGVLFRHIKKNDIAMTAPVEMHYAPPKDDGDALGPPQMMAFLYGQPAWGPTGADGVVTIVDVPAMTVASIGVRGPYTDERAAAAVEKLQQFIADSHGRYQTVGPPRVLGYNSPFVPAFLRYSEVQIPVRDKSQE